MTPAALSVLYAPFLLRVRMPFVERVTTTVRLSSGTKMRFFWRFGCLRTLPVGLNLVARIRLLYPPATLEPFFVTGQILAMKKSRWSLEVALLPSEARE